MEASYVMTRGIRFFIFVSFMFLNAILSIVSSVLQMVFRAALGRQAINAFFYALKRLLTDV